MKKQNRLKQIEYLLPHLSVNWSKQSEILNDLKQQKFSTLDEFLQKQIILINLDLNKSLQIAKSSSFVDFIEEMNQEEQLNTLKHIIPFMAELALSITEIDKIQILQQNTNSMISLTKRQVASLIANMFFCTTAKQISTQLHNHYNMRKFFQITNLVNVQKLKSLFIYFKRIAMEMEKKNNDYMQSIITFERCQFDQFPVKNWKKQQLMQDVQIEQQKNIQDFNYCFHIDFSNQYVGGSVLDEGCAYEENQFASNPEMLVLLLLCEYLNNEESIVIIGAEQFSEYVGYGSSYKFVKEQFVNLEKDNMNRFKHVYIAIDAIPFDHEIPLKDQFKEKHIMREIKKAVLGFQGSQSMMETNIYEKYQIVTGNWGCGTYLGDHQVKFLIQWIAASLVQRKMIYCTYGDQKTEYKIQNIINHFANKTVNDILSFIVNYKIKPNATLFDYILTKKKAGCC